MKELKRTRIGNFKIEDAGKFISLENVLEFMESDIDIAQNKLFENNERDLSNDEDLIKAISLKENDYQKVLNGVKIRVDNLRTSQHIKTKNG